MTKPKIWESRLLADPRNSRSIYFHLPTEHTLGSLDWTNVSVAFRKEFFRTDRDALLPEALPQYAYWEYRDIPQKKCDNPPDAFRAHLGVTQGSETDGFFRIVCARPCARLI